MLDFDLMIVDLFFFIDIYTLAGNSNMTQIHDFRISFIQLQLIYYNSTGGLYIGQGGY